MRLRRNESVSGPESMWRKVLSPLCVLHWWWFMRCVGACARDWDHIRHGLIKANGLSSAPSLDTNSLWKKYLLGLPIYCVVVVYVRCQFFFSLLKNPRNMYLMSVEFLINTHWMCGMVSDRWIAAFPIFLFFSVILALTQRRLGNVSFMFGKSVR